MENRTIHPIMVGLDGKSHERRKRGESDIQYKLIRNGTDEYKWWIEEAITADTAGGVCRLKRGRQATWEKTVSPTGKLLLALWIETLIGGDTEGAQWIPLDTDGNNTKHFRKDGTL